MLDQYRDIKIAYERELIEKFFDNARMKHYNEFAKIQKVYSKYMAARFVKLIMPKSTVK